MSEQQTMEPVNKAIKKTTMDKAREEGNLEVYETLMEAKSEDGDEKRKADKERKQKREGKRAKKKGRKEKERERNKKYRMSSDVTDIRSTSKQTAGNLRPCWIETSPAFYLLAYVYVYLSTFCLVLSRVELTKFCQSALWDIIYNSIKNGQKRLKCGGVAQKGCAIQ